ncbi:hypothetical protein QCA50_019501 [Cerrena zonata]|uniref:Protein kinase domain-containing protein n=1 Tax=Cerrena zonata TaxID=2478898 RepID=A0AAW0FEL2_9APHY
MTGEPNLANIVPANAFVNVTLSGVAPCDIHLTRGKPRRNRPKIDEQCKGRPPKRLPSKLPPPGTMELTLRLGQKIGSGAAGQVYEAVIQYDQSSPELRDMTMPPLVVKVSRPSKANSVAREAYYYEEMECLQGCVIPRYYGLYETAIPAACDFEPWSKNKAYCNQDTCRPHEILATPSEGTQVLSQPDRRSKMPCSSSRLNILILERVEGNLSLARDRSDDLRLELEEIYEHLATIGVDHGDVRYRNILQAPAGPNSLPPALSPWTQDTYAYRIVDFDVATKTNIGFSQLAHQFHQSLNVLLYNLPHDYKKH